MQYSSGSYSIAEAEGVERGTKIVITLKDAAHEFSNKRTIESTLWCLARVNEFTHLQMLSKNIPTLWDSPSH